MHFSMVWAFNPPTLPRPELLHAYAKRVCAACPVFHFHKGGNPSIAARNKVHSM